MFISNRKVDRSLMKEVVLGSLKVSVEKSEILQGGCILTLEGYVDTYNAVRFKEYITELYNNGYKHFIANCSKLKYLSSTGVGSIIAIIKELRADGGDFALMQMPQEVFQVIQILGFAKIIRNFANLDLCYEHFGLKSNIIESNAFKGFSFPAIAICPECSKKLKVGHAGRFRCIECKSIFAVNHDGSIVLESNPLSAAV